MGCEIERKFLVDARRWAPRDAGVPYRQGYLASEGATVRVRAAGARAWLTIKGPRTGIRRDEFEYEIPPADAAWMLANACRGPLVEKTRHREEHHGRIWEIDVFGGDNEGLILAEVELPDERCEVRLPDFVTEEVSADDRYANSNLSRRPYRTWSA